MASTMFCYCIIILIALIPSGYCQMRKATVTVTDFQLTNTVDDMFFSFGMDSNLIRNNWEGFNFSSPRLISMARALAPAYLRLSGTDADRLLFVGPMGETGMDEDGRRFDLDSQFPPSNFTMSTKQWDDVSRFVLYSGWQMIFGLNAQLRQGPSWDPSNARVLLDYSTKKGYFMHFELGNEPDLYPGQQHLKPINAEQLAMDYITLKGMLQKEFKGMYKRSMLIGPDLANGMNIDYASIFLIEAKHVLNATTFHHYYGGPELRYVENYTDPKLLNQYHDIAKGFHDSMKQIYPNISVWNGEASSTYGDPGTNIDMTYAASFMLLDKLGQSAALGCNVVIRQTFIGFWFALVDKQLNPTPNYYITLLYKLLVGKNVIPVSVGGIADGTVRAYGHCTNSNLGYPKGAVTVYAMNLGKDEVQLDFTGSLPGTDVVAFGLSPSTAGNLLSTGINLNDRMLVIEEDGNLPALEPIFIPADRLISLKGYSIGFYVFAEAQFNKC